jgi:hypothetical protein
MQDMQHLVLTSLDPLYQASVLFWPVFQQRLVQAQALDLLAGARTLRSMRLRLQ